MPPVIEARSLTRTYGPRRGIENLTLAVEPGEIYGCLGPNGSGKTTTIRLMLDFIRPSRGEIRVLGETPKRGRRLRRRIGYLPGELGFPEEMTGLGALKLYAGLSTGGYAPLRDWACDALQLSSADLRRRIRHYSKGTKQKLGIVQALQHDPDLLILDEPTDGLDPVVQARFFEVLREFRRRGRTVFFSTHVLSEVEALCDRVGVLREGQLVLDGRLSDLMASTDRLLYVRFAPPAEAGQEEAMAAPETPEAQSPGAEAEGGAPEGLVGAAEGGDGVASTPLPGPAPARADETAAGPAPADAGPPEIPGARFFRREGEWLVYAVPPRAVPDLLQYLATVRPLDFRLEAALDRSLLHLYSAGGGARR